MPTVEKTYRVAAGRENRAIAGLSMGGGQAIQIGLGHLDLFSQVMSVNETAAHLEVLLARGQVTRETSPEGADLYQTAPGTT